MKAELKGRWKLVFVRKYDGETWQTISEYHNGLTVLFHSNRITINHKGYTFQTINDGYVRFHNKADTLRLEFKRV